MEAFVRFFLISSRCLAPSLHARSPGWVWQGHRSSAAGVVAPPVVVPQQGLTRQSKVVILLISRAGRAHNVFLLKISVFIKARKAPEGHFPDFYMIFQIFVEKRV